MHGGRPHENPERVGDTGSGARIKQLQLERVPIGDAALSDYGRLM
jgi:hypothetical protein